MKENNVAEMKQLVNEVCRLSDEEEVYDEDYWGDDEDEELLEVMSEPVKDQMWLRYRNKGEYYKTDIADISREQYKGRSEEDLEEFRLEGLKKIADEPDPLKKLDIFYEYSRELKESLDMLGFMSNVYTSTKTLVCMDVCINLFASGKYTTLSEIKAIMPWLKLSDIFGFSIHCGYKFTPTEDELEVIKEEYHRTGEPESLKELFGEPQNTLNNLYNIFKSIKEKENE